MFEIFHSAWRLNNFLKILPYKIISRILYFDTHLSRISITRNLQRSILIITASRHYESEYHSPCIREGLPFFRLLETIHPGWTFHLCSIAGIVLSLWHFPYSTFCIYDRAKAVSFSPLEGMSRLSSLLVKRVYLSRMRVGAFYEFRTKRQKTF